MRLGKFFSEAIDVIEVAVRLVLVFLIELGVVEAFIIECSRFWRGRLRPCSSGVVLDRGGRLGGMMDLHCLHSESKGSNSFENVSYTVIVTPEHIRCHIRLLSARCMDLRLPTIRSDSATDTIQDIVAVLCALNSHCLAHDRATTGQDLEVGHGPSARRNMTSGGREGTKSGGGGFVEEGTHGTGLSKESLHCNYVVMDLYRVDVLIQLRE